MIHPLERKRANLVIPLLFPNALSTACPIAIAVSSK